MPHIHSIYDTDKHFRIDGVTRALTNEADVKNIIVQYDHNSERFTFELPRMIDGHDMSTCNVVQVHFINSGKSADQVSHGVYECDDVQVSTDDEEIVTCSWLVSSMATRFVGSLSFVLRFMCVTNGNVDYAWNTTVFNRVAVVSGICNSDEVVAEYADVLEQWRQILLGGGSGSGSGEVDMDEVMNYLRENLTAEDIGAIPSEGRKVENANIAFGAVTTGTLANKAVTTEKLSDDVIPGIVEDVLEQIPAGGEISDEQISDAVSGWLEEHPEATTTVANGSITQEKLANDAVTPAKTSFWGSEKPYIIGDNYPCQPVEVLPYRGVRTLGSKGWFLYLCERTSEKENVKVLPVKAGVMYTILPSSANHVYYGTEYTIADPTEADLQSWSNNSAYTGKNVLAKMLNITEAVSVTNTQQYTASALFRYTPPKDGFLFMDSICDASMLFEGASPFKIYENFLDKVYAGEIPNYNHLLYGYMAYAEKYSEFAKGKLRVETSDEFNRLLRTGKYWDDLHSSTVKLFVMGDSITWAASNIGADKAYRTLISNKYNIEHYNAAQNNTTITADLGDAWKVNSTTYSKGVDGLIEAHLAESQMETENDERYTNFQHCVNDYPIFTIAFGTNDFRYNAPIGTIDDTYSSTFMGGYKKLIARIRELYPNSSIILCTPWKQENWNTANSAGFVLADYNLAIHEIASKTRKCFVLDMFNNPYINERSNSRNGVYVDNVHLGKYGHILIAEELEKLILKCVVLNGYPYVKTNLADNWTGL